MSTVLKGFRKGSGDTSCGQLTKQGFVHDCSCDQCTRRKRKWLSDRYNERAYKTFDGTLIKIKK